MSEYQKQMANYQPTMIVSPAMIKSPANDAIAKFGTRYMGDTMKPKSIGALALSNSKSIIMGSTTVQQKFNQPPAQQVTIITKQTPPPLKDVDKLQNQQPPVSDNQQMFQVDPDESSSSSCGPSGSTPIQATTEPVELKPLPAEQKLQQQIRDKAEKIAKIMKPKLPKPEAQYPIVEIRFHQFFELPSVGYLQQPGARLHLKCLSQTLHKYFAVKDFTYTNEPIDRQQLTVKIALLQQGLNVPILFDYVDDVEQLYPFLTKRLIPKHTFTTVEVQPSRLLHKQKLDDSLAEAVCSLYKTTYPELFFVSPQIYRSNAVLEHETAQLLELVKSGKPVFVFSPYCEGAHWGAFFVSVNDIERQDVVVEIDGNDAENKQEKAQNYRNEPIDQKELQDGNNVNQSDQQQVNITIENEQIVEEQQQYATQIPANDIPQSQPIPPPQHQHNIKAQPVNKPTKPQYRAHFMDSLNLPVSDLKCDFKQLLYGANLTADLSRMLISNQRNDYDCGYCMLLALLKMLRAGAVPHRVSYDPSEVDALRVFLIEWFAVWAEARERAVIDIDRQAGEDGVIDLD